MRIEPRDSSLVRTLKQWHQDMSPEVRLVFDHDNRYEAIVRLADEQSNEPADLSGTAEAQAEYARRIGELAENLDQVGGRVDQWQGAARQAFDGTVQRVGDRVRTLHELGSRASELLQSAQRGRLAGDNLLGDLVRASIDYAENSLRAARTMGTLTGGAAMANWVVVNLRQVIQLHQLLVAASRRVNSLMAQVTLLVAEIAAATAELSAELAEVEERLRG